MIKIKKRSVKYVDHWYDYELEDGTLLHENEWNGEDYYSDGKTYEPIYKIKDKSLPIDEREYDIVAFVRHGT